MTTMYGIKNCDTIKKARKWLDENNVAYEFHDYKSAGITTEKIQQWFEQLGWETVLNKRGTTYRKLDDTIKQNLNAETAIQVLLDNPSMIKRPILESQDKTLIGFNSDEYTNLFK